MSRVTIWGTYREKIGGKVQPGGALCRIRGQRKQSGLRIDPIETMTNLSDILAQANLSLTLAPVDRRPNAWGDEEGPLRPLHFCYNLTGNGETLTGFYSAGCGCLASYTPGRISVYQAREMEEERKRYRPTDSDVIHALLLDASMDPEITFREWCDDMGMEGNPADALETYNTLRECRAKLRTMLGSVFDEAVTLAAEL